MGSFGITNYTVGVQAIMPVLKRARALSKCRFFMGRIRSSMVAWAPLNYNAQ